VYSSLAAVPGGKLWKVCGEGKSKEYKCCASDFVWYIALKYVFFFLFFMWSTACHVIAHARLLTTPYLRPLDHAICEQGGVLYDPLDDARTAGGALGIVIHVFAAVCLRPLPRASCSSKKPLNGVILQR
jgi:hypothetical protein